MDSVDVLDSPRHNRWEGVNKEVDPMEITRYCTEGGLECTTGFPEWHFVDGDANALVDDSLDVDGAGPDSRASAAITLAVPKWCTKTPERAVFGGQAKDSNPVFSLPSGRADSDDSECDVDEPSKYGCLVPARPAGPLLHSAASDFIVDAPLPSPPPLR